MKVLYVTEHLWNRQYGAGLRNYGILRHLGRHHELHIAVARADPNAGLQLGSNVPESFGKIYALNPAERATAWRADGKIFGPLARGQDMRGAFLRLVDRVKPDVIWYFEKYVVRRTGLTEQAPVVVDLVDVQWHKLLRAARYQAGTKKWAAWLKTGVSWVEDNWIARRAGVVVLANAHEAAFLRTRRPIIPVANGFDFPIEMPRNSGRARRVLFLGSLFYYPNLDGLNWFCSQVWPRIRAIVPDASLDVVGHVEKNVARLPQTPGVSYHGFVQDVSPFINAASCLVVPLRIAGGTRLKILEAWAMGLPVVSTTVGAEGLGAAHGQTLLIGDTAEEIATACVSLLQDPELGSRLATSASGYGRNHFDWQVVGLAIDRVLRAVRNV